MHVSAYRRISSLSTALLAVLTMGTASAGTITGSATYRERIALPPSAVFEVTVEDVSRADVPATVIGRMSFMPAGQVPIRFEVPYDVGQVQAGHRYSVRVRILEAGRLIFISTQAYPVLTQGAGETVEMVLQSVGRPPLAPDRSLVNTYWKMTSIGGTEVQAFPNQREPHMVLRADLNRVTGSGGCNEFTGTYEAADPSISFGHAAATARACPQGMEQETAFFQVLQRARAFRVRGDELELLDETGAPLAQFMAVDLK